MIRWSECDDDGLPGVTDILLSAVLARCLGTHTTAADCSITPGRSDNISSGGSNKLSPSIASADATNTSAKTNTKVKVEARVDAGIDTKPSPSSDSTKSKDSSLRSSGASCAGTGDWNPSVKVLISIL